MRAFVILLFLFGGATGARATCHVVDGKLVCPDAPSPTPGGVDIHPTFVDKLVEIKKLREGVVTAPIAGPGG